MKCAGKELLEMQFFLRENKVFRCCFLAVKVTDGMNSHGSHFKLINREIYTEDRIECNLKRRLLCGRNQDKKDSAFTLNKISCRQLCNAMHV